MEQGWEAGPDTDVHPGSLLKPLKPVDVGRVWLGQQLSSGDVDCGQGLETRKTGKWTSGGFLGAWRAWSG